MVAERGTRSFWKVAALVCVGLSGAVTGCHHEKPVSQAQQVQQALDHFYQDAPACLWQTDISLDAHSKPGETMTHAEAHALIGAGLLIAEGRHYNLTGAGRASWRPEPQDDRHGNLCYGTRKVSRITRMTPGQDLFGKVVHAAFDTVVPSPVGWAQLPQVQEAFPAMAMETSHALPHMATVRQTDKGWQVASTVVGALPVAGK